MSRPNPNPASDDGTDRPTTPGVGDDPRATLPEPLPPVRVPTEFNRTIPMGSSMVAEWMMTAQGHSTDQASAGQSGVHSLGPNPAPAATGNPVTKSDRVAKGTTLHSFGAAPPPVIETDDKRWIGDSVPQSFNTTQRGFASVPPSSLPPAKPTVTFVPPHSPATPHTSSPQARPLDLASTVRVMSVPPPAGSVPSSPPSRVAPPIVPSPTIKVSPEIAIPTRSLDAPIAPAIEAQHATTAPTSDRSPPLLPPPMNPSPAAAHTPGPSRFNDLRDQVRGWSTARLLTVAFMIALAAIAALILATTPSSDPTPTLASSAGPLAPSAAQLPSTELITNPPGAEIILRGALVANSPARVVRPSYESLYLVRLRGYQPQLVALAPHSPDTIRIDLQPLTTPVPAPDTTTAQPPAATNTAEAP